ncbi:MULTISPECIES: tRNA-dihydrouridine synthase [Pseudoalteromonas]|uniref:tRNA-dihydrouridine synthase n=1 Tax=Pseudoalteromonas TaxID=53246 RepID=UPI000C79BF0E|nr:MULTISPECIES: tRNA-dihydrouridine synthase [unclassified Pseudoalteromonas]AUJ69558.1 tRNA-dihydrouridine synthase C [Pseudoalteromonas sp. NC201]MCF7515082.1 tRNA-dihydrouridine synthase [Pseudoalteromonas sp. L7]MCF7526994.1 tRNA-dihydrouridine synthase [Pseudoalteromonas sp. L23]MCG7552559.1 tRNA-dihydrouridine synthase [Pseudoalteromonas sp. Of11M-6]MCX2767401.1 tRNA-dihydrouridine synthase [Pseudoalteromonas sp. B530]
MKLVLAPMEGVVDFKMRELLTDLGGFDLCVTEFIRVVDLTFPRRVFTRYCPELLNGGYTRAGTPVRVQLLGQVPHALAANARKAVKLGSHGVDLNFGCPAKTVNKSRGGAVLLKEPEQIYQIIKAVRDAVPEKHQVSAKIRLGFDDDANSTEIVDAVQQGGASSLAIHARTKRDGYKPPAYWEKIPSLLSRLTIPVVANGEIWQVEDALLCQTRSQCQDLMLGRGALATPDLAAKIKAHVSGTHYTPLTWENVVYHILHSSMHQDENMSEKYFSARTKQWLSYLKRQYDGAHVLFDEIKTLKSKDDVMKVLQKYAMSPDIDSNHNSEV